MYLTATVPKFSWLEKSFLPTASTLGLTLKAVFWTHFDDRYWVIKVYFSQFPAEIPNSRVKITILWHLYCTVPQQIVLLHSIFWNVLILVISEPNIWFFIVFDYIIGCEFSPILKNTHKSPNSWVRAMFQKWVEKPYWRHKKHPCQNSNPLYTNELFLLVWYNLFGIVHCTYLGVSGYHFQNILYFLSKDLFFYLDSVDPVEMQHYAAFHLGLHCLQKVFI